MPRPRSAMLKIREVLRLSLAKGLSPRQVSASLGVPRITVRRFVERAKLAGLSWPLPEGMDDQALGRRLGQRRLRLPYLLVLAKKEP